MIASAMMTAMTPTMTPIVVKAEMTEMNACRVWRADTGRRCGCRTERPSISLSQQRKQDHVTNRRTVGQEHHQPVDAEAFAGGRRKPIFERPDVASSISWASRSLGHGRSTGPQAPPLLDWVVQLAEGIRNLKATDVTARTARRCRNRRVSASKVAKLP